MTMKKNKVYKINITGSSANTYSTTVTEESAETFFEAN